MYKHMPTATGIKVAVCGYFSRDYSLSVLSGCEVNVVGTVCLNMSSHPTATLLPSTRVLQYVGHTNRVT